MANDSALLSTASSVLGDVVTSNASNTGDVLADPTTSLWRWVWPLLCVTGLVGNSLVLLVLRQDGLVRTSANVFLTILAVGDSLVLMVASVAVYPGVAWGFWLEDTNVWACRTTRSAHNTLEYASIWIIAAFTAERSIATRSLLLKRRMHTPRSALLCCVALLMLAFVKNIDLVIMSNFITTSWGDVTCYVTLRYMDYIIHYRPWINFVVNSAVPVCIVVVCNLVIVRQLRQNLMPTAVRDSVRRTTRMCLCVSFAFLVCVVPYYVFALFKRHWPMTPLTVHVATSSLSLLRYVNHAINVFLYSLTGAHFRRELVALFRSCIHRGRAAASVVRRLPTRVSGRVEFRRGFEEDLEMR